MRIRLHLPYIDIDESCDMMDDFDNDVEISINDVKYISFNELVTLLSAFPEYIQPLKKILAEWDKEEGKE